MFFKLILHSETRNSKLEENGNYYTVNGCSRRFRNDTHSKKSHICHKYLILAQKIQFQHNSYLITAPATKNTDQDSWCPSLNSNLCVEYKTTGLPLHQPAQYDGIKSYKLNVPICVIIFSNTAHTVQLTEENRVDSLLLWLVYVQLSLSKRIYKVLPIFKTTNIVFQEVHCILDFPHSLVLGSMTTTIIIYQHASQNEGNMSL